MGRFERDPLGFAGRDANLYRYVQQPAELHRPHGETACWRTRSPRASPAPSSATSWASSAATWTGWPRRPTTRTPPRGRPRHALAQEYADIGFVLGFAIGFGKSAVPAGRPVRDDARRFLAGWWIGQSQNSWQVAVRVGCTIVAFIPSPGGGRRTGRPAATGRRAAVRRRDPADGQPTAAGSPRTPPRPPAGATPRPPTSDRRRAANLGTAAPGAAAAHVRAASAANCFVAGTEVLMAQDSTPSPPRPPEQRNRPTAGTRSPPCFSAWPAGIS
jgi:hypothetical protein